MKKNIVLLIMCLMVISVFAGCSNNGQTGAKLTPTPETTPTPEVTFTPTPTPVQDKYVDLTNEEIKEYLEMRDNYPGIYNKVTREIVAYYKYIGLDDFLLPVVIDYTISEAEAELGGEWEVLDGVEVNLKGKIKNDVWLRGKLTVAQIEDTLLNGNEDKVFVLADLDIETKYKGEEYVYGYPPMRPHSDYMTWKRYWGDAFIYEWEEDNGERVGLLTTAPYIGVG